MRRAWGFAENEPLIELMRPIGGSPTLSRAAVRRAGAS